MTKATGTTQYIQAEEVTNNEEFGDQLLKMAVGLNNLAESGWAIGDIRQSLATEEYFQSVSGDNWVRINGQDISGSDLDIDYGIDTLPDLVTLNACIGQKRSTESIFDVINSQNKTHSHRVFANVEGSGGASSFARLVNSRTSSKLVKSLNNTNWTYITGSDGEVNARPNGIGVNYFIKINNEATNF